MTRIDTLALKVLIVNVLISIEVNPNENVRKDFRFISYQGNYEFYTLGKYLQ